jgi:hypothetical protein
MVTRRVSEAHHSASPPSREGRGEAEYNGNPTRQQGPASSYLASARSDGTLWVRRFF